MGRKFLNFFSTPTGKLTAFGVVAALILLIVYGIRGGAYASQTTPTPTIAVNPNNPLSNGRSNQTVSFQPDDVPFNPPPPKKPALPQQPLTEQTDQQQQQKRPPILGITIYNGYAEDTKNTPPALSEDYAPYGRLVPCKLIITVDSSAAETPIIGITTEDVYRDGHLIIPAGCEVHGTAQTDRVRERIESGKNWIIVFPDASQEELNLKGIALDRDSANDDQHWGLTDGSAGLRGTLIKSDKWAELKIFAAAFLSAGAQGLQSTNQNNVTGTQQYESTPKNAALAGTSAVINQYAKMLLEQIKENGFYVRVSAGTQFYLYVEQPIDRQAARVGESQLAPANDTNKGNRNQSQLDATPTTPDESFDPRGVGQNYGPGTADPTAQNYGPGTADPTQQNQTYQPYNGRNRLNQ